VLAGPAAAGMVWSFKQLHLTALQHTVCCDSRHHPLSRSRVAFTSSPTAIPRNRMAAMYRLYCYIHRTNYCGCS
jgi:hypothetical protein